MTMIPDLLAVIALLLGFEGTNDFDRGAPAPVEQSGRCRGSGIGQAFLRDAGAEALPTPECDRAVWIGDASISFFRAGDRTPLFLFSGRTGTRAGFDVERIGIGSDPVRETSSGQCLGMGRWGVMCHAVFEEDGVRKGVALTFDFPPAPDSPGRGLLR